MAIAFVASRGSNTATAAGTSFAIDLPAGASITPGNTLIASLAFRDVVTPPTDPKSIPGDNIALDTRGNLWRRVGFSTNQGASTAADNGAVAHIWVCHVVFPYVNGDDIVFRAPITSRPMTHAAGEIFEFSGVRRVSRAFDFDSNTGNSAASTVTGIAPAAVGRLVFGTVAVATNPTLTGDGDATDGVWSAISQNASTGIRRGSQYKIVTGTGAQTWDTTWTGTQQWAAAAVVLEVSLIGSWPFNDTRLANPGYACPSGPEILPTSRTQTPIDTGTAYLFDCDIPAESLGASSIYGDAFIELANDNVDVQHRVAIEVYERGAELSRTDPFIFTLGTPNHAVAQNGTVTTTGSSTAADLVAALSGSGDEQVVLIDPGTPDATEPSSIDLYWDTSALLPFQDTHRILNIRLSYVAWKDDAAAAEPGEGLAVFWRDELVFSAGAPSRPTSLYGAWLVNDYRTSAGRVYRNLGEVCGLPRLGANIGEQFGNVQACWTIRDLLHMSTGDRSTMFSVYGLNGSHPSQETVFLDTIRLDVFLVPETRLAQGVRRICSGVGFPAGNLDPDAWTGEKLTPLYQATNSGTFWQAPSTPTPITVAVREPIVSTGSDWYSAQTDPDILNNTILRNARYSTQEAVGPSVVMRSLTQPRETLDPQVSVRRVEWSNGQVAENADPEPFGSMIQSISLIDLNSYSGFWPYYIVDNFLPETARTGSTLQQDIGVDGGTSFDVIKILVKPSALTEGDLNISVEQPTSTVLATASLTVEECLALPDVGNGYREARLPLSTTITPSSGTVEVYMSSTNAFNAGWIIGEGIDGTGRFDYDAQPLAAPTAEVDFAVTLCCPLAEPDISITTGTATFPATSDKCLTTSTDIPCLEIANATEYDYIGISRVTGTEVTPVTVITGSEPVVEVTDTFTRNVVNGWGTTNTGQVWEDTGTPYQVNGTQGTIQVAAAGNANVIFLDGPDLTDVEITMDAGTTALSTGGSQEVGIIARAQDNNNFYVYRVRFSSLGVITSRIYALVGGLETLLTTADTYPPDHVAGRMYTLKFRLTGTELRGKVWDPTLDNEPAEWQVVAIDNTYSSGVAGAWGARLAGNTNAAAPQLFDNYEVTNLVTPKTWCDYGVPWDLISGSIEYLVTGYRENDRAESTVLVGPWAGTSVAPGAAFGLAGEDFLVAYVPVSDSGELQVTWNPLNPIESMPLAGVDYQVALRASEERGLSVTVTVVADHLLRCELEESGEVEQRSPGRESLSPSPYDLIRSLESIDRLELKLPGGHTRYVTLDVGALVSTPVYGIYMAEITLTDTVAPGTYPYVAPGGEPIEGLES